MVYVLKATICWFVGWWSFVYWRFRIAMFSHGQTVVQVFLDPRYGVYHPTTLFDFAVEWFVLTAARSNLSETAKITPTDMHICKHTCQYSIIQPFRFHPYSMPWGSKSMEFVSYVSPRPGGPYNAPLRTATVRWDHLIAWNPTGPKWAWELMFRRLACKRCFFFFNPWLGMVDDEVLA